GQGALRQPPYRAPRLRRDLPQHEQLSAGDSQVPLDGVRGDPQGADEPAQVVEAARGVVVLGLGQLRGTPCITIGPHVRAVEIAASAQRGVLTRRGYSEALAMRALAASGALWHSSKAVRMIGATMVASDSITNMGVLSVSLSQVIFSF